MVKLAKNTIAFGTMAMPRRRHAFTPRPFPIRPSKRFTAHQGLSVGGRKGVLNVELTVMGVRCDDDDEKDRHRRNRGGALGLMLNRSVDR